MLLVAVMAFLGNGAATLLLQKISARNINMKSAWLHSLQDALFSLGVIVGALLIIFFGWSLVDPILSLAICLVIAREIYRIVRQAVNSLLDAVPPGIDFLQVKNDLLAIPAVAEVNDLHIWQTGADQQLLSPISVPRGIARQRSDHPRRSRRCCCTGTGSITRRSRSCLFPPGRWSTATTAIEQYNSFPSSLIFW